MVDALENQNMVKVKRTLWRNLRPSCMAILILLFLVIFAFLSTNTSSVYADKPTVKAEGILTSIEKDGTIIIDGKGYLVDRSLLVVNLKGRPVSLNKLRLPAPVRFEYRYAPEGFVIEYIEQIKSFKRRTR